MTKRKNNYEEIGNKKRRKILPDSAIKKEVQNLTPFVNKSAKGRRLFPEKQKQMNFLVVILPLLAVGIYSALTFSTNIADFNLFTAIGIFVAVTLLCFCLIRFIECNDRNGSNKEEKNLSTIESSTTYAIQGMVKM